MMSVMANGKGLKGVIGVPGDKSISHRAVMFGSIAHGKTVIDGFLPGEDCLSTIECFRQLGVKIEQENDHVEIFGKGIKGLQEPNEILNVGNSGTTCRLLLGMLANTPFFSCVVGDDSIAKRPMQRVTEPLKVMGAIIDGREQGCYTPLSIRGGNLKGINYVSPVASAQVKSAVLLAGLQAEGTTTLTEPMLSRDHTERMLRAFGCHLVADGLTVSLEGKQELQATHIEVPGDLSSAAFFLVAGAIVPNSHITIKKVCINPTRTGILDVLKEMGAEMTISNTKTHVSEPYADIHIKTSSLTGIEISGETIPRLIDEIPIIALAATQAKGTTIIKDAGELKVKETNRIDMVVNELVKLGADIEATEDGMVIQGTTNLRGNFVDSHGDHRIGMMLAIASCIVNGETSIDNSESVNVSFPSFFDQLEQLKH